MEMIVNKNELFDEVLVRPANEADSLIIVSGFATSAMVEYQISSIRKKLGKEIAIELLVGMTPIYGVSEIHHRNFIKLHKEIDFNCSSKRYSSGNWYSKCSILFSSTKSKIKCSKL